MPHDGHGADLLLKANKVVHEAIYLYSTSLLVQAQDHTQDQPSGSDAPGKRAESKDGGLGSPVA